MCGPVLFGMVGTRCSVVGCIGRANGVTRASIDKGWNG